MDKTKFQILFYYYRLLHPAVTVSAQIPLAQAVLESANFTSNVFKTNNNCMGMGIPSVREFLGTNKGQKGFAKYDSAADGVADYVLFLDQLGLHTDEKLTAYIAAGKYGADKQYLAKVQKGIAALNASGSYISPTAIAAGATAAAVAAALGLGYVFTKVIG